MADFEPGMAVIVNRSKRSKGSGTVVAVCGDMVQVELQQPYRGADGNTHMSIWKQHIPACKLTVK